MKISVWDTYVKREDGKMMHFDILVPQEMQDKAIIYDFGCHYLMEKDFSTENLDSNRCNFCHIEEASQDIIFDIKNKGYHIIEMENCC